MSNVGSNGKGLQVDKLSTVLGEHKDSFQKECFLILVPGFTYRNSYYIQFHLLGFFLEPKTKKPTKELSGQY
jgi:hypothetical protein